MNKHQPNTLTSEYFEEIYRRNSDPWNFAQSDYEHQKYQATLDALPQEKYESAFEIGCSIGVLTVRLAERVGQLLAVDVSEIALAQAAARCRDLTNVRFEKMRIPDQFPIENFDLIVVSEVGYYLAPADWQIAVDKIIAHTKSGGSIALVHWTPFVHDYPQSGDEVHERFFAKAKSHSAHIFESRADKYRIDVWQKND